MSGASAPLSMLQAMTAGVLSFISPSSLILLVPFFSFITAVFGYKALQAQYQDQGQSQGQGPENSAINEMTVFLFGVFLIFFIRGVSDSVVSAIFALVQGTASWLGGLFLILIGIYFAGFLPDDIEEKLDRLYREYKPALLVLSFFAGAGLGFGWVPRPGPILGSIIILTGTLNKFGAGVFLLLIYIAGLGILIACAGLLFERALLLLPPKPVLYRRTKMVSGAVLSVTGGFIFFNIFGYLMYGFVW